MDLYRHLKGRIGLADQPTFFQPTVRWMARRIVNSYSRANGARAHRNRFLNILTALNIEMDVKIIPFVMDAILQLPRANPKSVRRALLMLELATNDDMSGAVATLNRVRPAFEHDLPFWTSVVQTESLQVGHCGHAYEYAGERVVDEHSVPRRICSQCARELMASGAYQRTESSGTIIPVTFIGTGRGADGELITFDLRADGFRLDEESGEYWHRNYSPYRHLIGSYHSSQSRGFSPIDSPWARTHRRLFGCELEVSVISGETSTAAYQVHKILNPSGNKGEYCFFEYDGSVPHGFEIVTQPAGLDVHREKFKAFLNSNAKKGMRSHEGGRCGFHVHIGRECLSQSQIFRMQAFLHDRRNEQLITRIARRYSTGYCKVKPELGKLAPKERRSYDRYEFLNCTGSNTVEMRVFRGSLRYESIMAALEFTNALIDFCSPGTVAISEFNAAGFERFLLHASNSTDTKYLRGYLNLDSQTDDEQLIAA